MINLSPDLIKKHSLKKQPETTEENEKNKSCKCQGDEF